MGRDSTRTRIVLERVSFSRVVLELRANFALCSLFQSHHWTVPTNSLLVASVDVRKSNNATCRDIRLILLPSIHRRRRRRECKEL